MVAHLPDNLQTRSSPVYSDSACGEVPTRTDFERSGARTRTPRHCRCGRLRAALRRCVDRRPFYLGARPASRMRARCSEVSSRHMRTQRGGARPQAVYAGTLRTLSTSRNRDRSHGASRIPQIVGIQGRTPRWRYGPRSPSRSGTASHAMPSQRRSSISRATLTYLLSCGRSKPARSRQKAPSLLLPERITRPLRRA